MARWTALGVSAVLACVLSTSAALAQPAVDALGDALPTGALARLGTTRMRHSSTQDNYVWGIGCLAWSGDGKMIATTSYSHTIGVEARLWNAATGKALGALENNLQVGPSFVRFSPDSKTLAAAARDKIILWDTATGKERARLVGHQSDVDAMAFQDGGKTMVSVSRDGAVHWWDIAGKKSIGRWQLPANDPDKTDQGKPVLHRGLRNACFSPDGTTLAVAKWWAAEPPTTQVANQAVVYDLSARKELWREGAMVTSYRFAFTPDGKCLAVGRGAIVRLRETATGYQLAENLWIYPSGMSFAPDGKTLAICTNGEVAFWSPDAKTPLRKVDVPLHVGGYNTFAAIPAYSPDGKKLAIDRNRTFRVLDVTTGKPALSWPSYDEGFRNLAFAADGRSLIETESAIAFDTATWRQRAAFKEPPFEEVQAVSVERTFCVAVDGKHLDTLFDMKTGRPVVRLDVARVPGSYRGFFSPGTSLFVKRDRPCVGGEVDTVFAVPSGKRLFQLSFTMRLGTDCWCFSADDARVAFFDRSTSTIHVHDTATGKLRWQFAAATRHLALALSPRGNMLAIWSRGERTVHIRDLRTGNLRRTLALKQNALSDDHACLAWSPDERTLAVGGLDDAVRIWEVASAQVRREFHGHQARATCLAFSRDGRLLASGSDDTTLLIWDPASSPARLEAKRRATLSEQELSALWDDLAADAGTAHAAQRALLHARASAVPFLARRLQPAPAVNAEQVAALIKGLDSKEFRAREKATRDLERLGESARAAIARVLAADPPAETRRRLEELLDRMDQVQATSAQLRCLRAIEILEAVHMPESMRIIERLSQGNPGCLVTAESRTVLARMKK